MKVEVLAQAATGPRKGDRRLQLGCPSESHQPHPAEISQPQVHETSRATPVSLAWVSHTQLPQTCELNNYCVTQIWGDYLVHSIIIAFGNRHGLTLT